MDNPLVTPDPGLFIWTIVTFLVFVALLTKFAWRPLLAALERREKLIARAIDDSEKARADLERVQQDAAKLLADARVEGEAIVTRSRAAADRLGEELRQKASAEAAGILKKAEREIQLETSTRHRARSPRSGRALGGDRVEDPAPQRLGRRQSRPDRRQPAPARYYTPLTALAPGMPS